MHRVGRAVSSCPFSHTDCTDTFVWITDQLSTTALLNSVALADIHSWNYCSLARRLIPWSWKNIFKRDYWQFAAIWPCNTNTRPCRSGGIAGRSTVTGKVFVVWRALEGTSCLAKTPASSWNEHREWAKRWTSIQTCAMRQSREEWGTTGRFHLHDDRPTKSNPINLSYVWLMILTIEWVVLSFARRLYCQCGLYNASKHWCIEIWVILSCQCYVQ